MNKHMIDVENDFIEEEETVFTSESGTEREEKSRKRTMEETVITKYKLGVTVKQLQKDYNISSGKVYEILARHKVPLRQGRYQASKSNERLQVMTELEKQSLIRDYKEGLPLSSLYIKYDINKHGCYSILDEAGVPRKHERGHGKGEYITPEVADEMVKNIEKRTSEESKADVSLHGSTLHIKLNAYAEEPIEAIHLSLDYGEDA